MHPEDVADYISSEVEELGRRMTEMPALRVGEVTLEQETELYLGFSKVDHGRLEVATAPGILGPRGRPIAFNHAAIDLSDKRERELILHMNCENFDCDPPTAQLLLPDRSELPAPEWPQDLTREGLAQGHPKYQRPFFCRRGLREYHSHPGHEDDPWDLHREAISLHQIAIELLFDLQDRWTLR